MLTVTLILLLAAFITAVMAALGRAPLYIAVILVILILLVANLPIR
jgi:hypothetical protein